MPLCAYCSSAPAVLKRPKSGDAICKACFLSRFEEEVHSVITSQRLFAAGERVAIAASGGKDSTVLAHVLCKLNRERAYGLDLFLLSVDEGISGYRDDSLRSVRRNKAEYGLDLFIVSYADLYGWSMDAIVQAVGRRSNCTFCGVFRRQALDRGAVKMRADKLVTGHNADDLAETVLMNLLRGDVARLERSVAISTGVDAPLPRVKPFKYAYEKEIVMYAYYQRLDYFSTECVYSPYAYRGFARAFLKEAEAIRPSAIVDIVRSGEQLLVREDVKRRREGEGKGRMRLCERCGYLSSNALCKACTLLHGLNKGRPRVEVSLEGARHDEETKEGGEGGTEEEGKGQSGGRGEAWEEAIDVTSVRHREEVSAVFGRRPLAARRVGEGSEARGSPPFVIAETMHSNQW